MKKIQLPLTMEDRRSLRAGEQVLLSGVIYTARDAAHKRMKELLDAGAPLPFDLKDQIIYYVGPTQTPPGMTFGSAGPTTATRMDVYTPQLLDLGLAGMIVWENAWFTIVISCATQEIFSTSFPYGSVSRICFSLLKSSQNSTISSMLKTTAFCFPGSWP